MTSWLSGAGYRDFQVAALAQLADVESGFRPCAASPGGYRYLLQWGAARGCGNCARSPRPPTVRICCTQLAFTDKELRHDPKFFSGTSTKPAAYVALRRIFGRGSCQPASIALCD
jgi:hypothetical protein